MSRRHSAEKREINPDPKFGDLVVTKFMNAVMYDGKKSVAETIVYGALDQVQAKTKQEPVTVFHPGARQCRAACRSPFAPRRRRHLPGSGRRASGAPPGAGDPLADHGCAQPQRDRPWSTASPGELMDAANNRGTAVKKREDTHKMAEANRAFAHYRW